MSYRQLHGPNKENHTVAGLFVVTFLISIVLLIVFAIVWAAAKPEFLTTKEGKLKVGAYLVYSFMPMLLWLLVFLKAAAVAV